MKSVSQGILLWGQAVLPALFPFFFFTKLMAELGVIDVLAQRLNKLMRTLFNVPGIVSYVFCMSIISGYPVGAKLIGELHDKGALSKGAVYRALAFCSTSGPLFVIGTVGVAFFASKLAGVIILVVHILSAIINGLLWRRLGVRKEPEAQLAASAPPQSLGKALGDSIYNSVISILIVGGYVAIFFMIIDILNNWHILSTAAAGIGWVLGLFGIDPELASGISGGIIEITRGTFDLGKSGAGLTAMIVAGSAIISWGGLSIHMQALTFLKNCRLNLGIYFAQKVTHGIIAAGMALAMCVIIPL